MNIGNVLVASDYEVVCHLVRALIWILIVAEIVFLSRKRRKFKGALTKLLRKLNNHTMR